MFLSPAKRRRRPSAGFPNTKAPCQKKRWRLYVPTLSVCAKKVLRKWVAPRFTACAASASPYEHFTAALSRLSANGTPAQLAIRVTVRECFFHCAKALLRSQLWKPETWAARIPFSWGKYLAAKGGDDEEAARKIDQAVAQDYKNNL